MGCSVAVELLVFRFGLSKVFLTHSSIFLSVERPVTDAFT